jgi:hypothetical protein
MGDITYRYVVRYESLYDVLGLLGFRIRETACVRARFELFHFTTPTPKRSLKVRVFRARPHFLLLMTMFY